MCQLKRYRHKSTLTQVLTLCFVFVFFADKLHLTHGTVWFVPASVGSYQNSSWSSKHYSSGTVKQTTKLKIFS